MVLHELATSAVNSGALSNATGSIRLDWTLREVAGGPGLQLCWRERGGLPVRVPSQKGFGSRLIEAGLEKSQMVFSTGWDELHPAHAIVSFRSSLSSFDSPTPQRQLPALMAPLSAIEYEPDADEPGRPHNRASSEQHSGLASRLTRSAPFAARGNFVSAASLGTQSHFSKSSEPLRCNRHRCVRLKVSAQPQETRHALAEHHPVSRPNQRKRQSHRPDGKARRHGD